MKLSQRVGRLEDAAGLNAEPWAYVWVMPGEDREQALVRRNAELAKEGCDPVTVDQVMWIVWRMAEKREAVA